MITKPYNNQNPNIQKDAFDMLESVRSIISIIKKEKTSKEFK